MNFISDQIWIFIDESYEGRTLDDFVDKFEPLGMPLLIIKSILEKMIIDNEIIFDGEHFKIKRSAT